MRSRTPTNRKLGRGCWRERESGRIRETAPFYGSVLCACMLPQLFGETYCVAGRPFCRAPINSLKDLRSTAALNTTVAASTPELLRSSARVTEAFN